MRNFILGLVVAAGPVCYAAGAFGTGYMHDWTVEVDGDEVCSDPYVWAATHVIECD